MVLLIIYIYMYHFITAGNIIVWANGQNGVKQVIQGAHKVCAVLMKSYLLSFCDCYHFYPHLFLVFF